jgi:hypothetical protein
MVDFRVGKGAPQRARAESVWRQPSAFSYRHVEFVAILLKLLAES